MCYTEEQIERYLEILNSYTKRQVPSTNQEDNHFTCWNCQSDCFFVELGYYKCDSCGSSNGHALGYFDLKKYDRFHYRRMSIYQRKYHYGKNYF